MEIATEIFDDGISNGFVGASGSDTGAGISFAPGPDSKQSRWMEQRI
ncbi:MAG: hypothetical protein ACN6RK_01780 [Stenotrophomonas sp.]